MNSPDQAAGDRIDCDSSIIRREMRAPHIRLRRERVARPRLRGIRNGLLALHALEVMAVSIYRFQITKKNSDHNRQLIAAMCNEMTHVQDFQVKLFEYGWKPSKLRWIHWIVGSAIGLGSRLMGTKAILRADIWLESRAVHGYEKLLQTIDWDDETRGVIERDQADEVVHITRWKQLLRSTQTGGTAR